MKKAILAAIAVLPLAALAQKPFTISGHVKGLKTGDKVYLIYKSEGKDFTDSAMVTNGVFAFKGSINEPAKGNLTLNKNPFVTRQVQGEILDFTPIYIEPGAIKVTAADSLKKVVIAGSAVNDDSKKMEALVKPITVQMGALEAQYMALSAEEKKAQQKELAGKFVALQNQIKTAQMDFAKNNPKSFISLMVLNGLAADETYAAEAEKVFNTMTPALKATTAGLKLSQLFAAGKNTAVGAVALDFTQNDVNDKPVKLSDLKGKYVLLDFWASWCGPCRAENPNVVAAYNKYKDKNFTVLGVSLDNPGKKDAWLGAIEKDGLKWTNVSDLKGWANAAAAAYGIRSIPANFLIDPSGKIIAKNLRGEDLNKKLAELLDSTSK